MAEENTAQSSNEIQSPENNLSSEEKKRLAIEQERTSLLARLSEFNLEDIRTKVAFVLNQYPATRNSDTDLTIKYWEIFHGDLVDADSVSFDSLRKLPKFTSIARARAKIQNDFGLYHATEAVATRRAELDAEHREAQMEDQPKDSVVSIFCDESGKTARYNLVASLWINDSYRMFRVFQDLLKWRNDRGIEKELHFANLTASDKPIVQEFINKVLSQSDALGFKAVILDSSTVRSMSPEERNFRLHYQLIIKGIEHEVQTGRFILPRNISVTKDKDDGADKLRLSELEQKLKTDCRAYFNPQIAVDEVKAEESHSSMFIQLADLFAASINRKLNNPGSNYKDELADIILQTLGISDVTQSHNSAQDFATILWL